MTDSNEAQDPTQAARREESPARLKRPLIRLAKACGVSTSYIDQLGAYVEIRDEVLVSVLASLAVGAWQPQYPWFFDYCGGWCLHCFVVV